MNHMNWKEAPVVVMQEFDQVMMCYPNPDVVCLEGGCIHCEDSHTWWTLDALRKYADDNDMMKAHKFGDRSSWWNLPKKMGDTGEPFFGAGNQDSEE